MLDVFGCPVAVGLGILVQSTGRRACWVQSEPALEVEATPAHRTLIRSVATSLRETGATRSMKRSFPKAAAGERP